jgi:hypothetical protein
MPRFYFDIDDGAALMRDSQGSDLIDIAAAEREATETLVQLAGDVFRSKPQGELAMAIRDETGIALRSVRLTITVEEYH